MLPKASRVCFPVSCCVGLAALHSNSSLYVSPLAVRHSIPLPAHQELENRLPSRSPIYATPIGALRWKWRRGTNSTAELPQLSPTLLIPNGRHGMWAPETRHVSGDRMCDLSTCRVWRGTKPRTRYWYVGRERHSQPNEARRSVNRSD